MVLAIGLMINMKNNIFQKARIKLTLYYIAIMAVILITFSSVLIFTIESKIREGFKGSVVVSQIENDIDPINSTSDDIEMLIYIVDGILLVIIGFSSYFLAGKTLKPIKEAMESQKKFSADASHDLRTPLAIMTTESEVTLQNKNASVVELRETIESNLEETKKMSKLVHDLLLISRGDNQATIYSYTKIDLHKFIDRIVQKIKPYAEDKGLKMNLCEYKKVLVTVDEDNSERAISNIVQNAIKYTKTGTIAIDLKEENQKVVITISDTGVGIPERDLPHVFDRFYKAEHSRNDNSGSGLGLPIAKLIVEEHKGTIHIESKVNSGTIVTITIPKS
jgi:signal transduction histidine kinase